MAPVSLRVRAKVLIIAWKSSKICLRFTVVSFPIIPPLSYAEAAILAFLLFIELARHTPSGWDVLPLDTHFAKSLCLFQSLLISSSSWGPLTIASYPLLLSVLIPQEPAFSIALSIFNHGTSFIHLSCLLFVYPTCKQATESRMSAVLSTDLYQA